jgi:hypothetical protein
MNKTNKQNKGQMWLSLIARSAGCRNARKYSSGGGDCGLRTMGTGGFDRSSMGETSPVI